MYLVAIAWGYVVLMMAVAEATHSQGSLLGAVITFLLYGVLPLAVVLYIMGTPMRRRARQRQEQQTAGMSPDLQSPSGHDDSKPS
jgi:membrane protein implicated in regulation of membrane protease activity